ncbi:MAG: DUF885 domain-containing protein [Woeseiaceae bacterium]|nr:DUF885 domain-containing protein [Woeseiaceae bacterium]
MRTLILAGVAAVLAACQGETPPAETPAEAAVDAPSPAAMMNEIADRVYARALERSPEIAYFAAIELDRHDGMFDNSPAALAAAQAEEDAFLAEVEAINSAELVGKPEWIARALIEQQLRANVAQRICRQELWNISQMGGWHSGYAQIAMLQPVDTAELREQALTRWSKFPAFVEQEIANLKAGVEQGYTVPKSVTGRVIAQIDGLLALPTEQSPFYSMAVRAGDDDFAAGLRELVETGIQPALQRARDYLQNEYLPVARDELSITVIPNGRECYDALLYGYTTLDRSGEDVYELGQATVAANKAGIIELGRAAYETEDFDEILERAKNDPADKFENADELLQFSKDMVDRAAVEMPNWVGTMPEQAVEVVPFEKHEEGTGRSAHYNPGNADRPAEYRIPLATPEEEGRGNAEATAFHEAWPGHHLQVATFQAVDGLHPVTRIIWFSGPGEGWARYSEALAEEMGLYLSTSGPILRRAWPARGMVVDPGIHLFGWTREEAKAYMAESGRFPVSSGDEMVDRIAIIPGQLTAYDSGGLEILALRRQAEAALGDDFDIREFHDRVLENGTIPLGYLSQHIEAWIASQQN